MFPVATFLFGGIVNYIVLITMPANSELLGVSGVVYWMGSVWLTLYFLIETREKISRRLIKTIGIAAVLFIPETYHRNVSYLSHFVGFALGMVFALLYFRQNRLRFQRAEFIEWVNNDGDVIPPEPRY